MALPFVLALVALVYLKPQEFIPLLAGLPLLHLVFVAAVAAVAYEISTGTLALRPPPQWRAVTAFALWALFVLLLRNRWSVPRLLAGTGTGVGIFFLAGMGLGTPSRVRTLGAVLLAFALMLATLGVHQSTQDFVCYFHEEDGEWEAPTLDGHPCEGWRDCEFQSQRWDIDWECERPGLFGTSSVAHGRVRYRGSLADPNELALVIGIALPFGFALREGPRRKQGRLVGRLLALAGLALAAWCIVETKSRGGQLVFAAVIGLYFIRRFRIWGAFIGAAATLPVVLLGGREGAEADSSAMERIEAWYEGINMIREHPLLGVGPGEFVEHHVRTAHNAYVLVAAETGLIGFLLWSVAIYTTMKIPWSLWWHGDRRLEPSLAPFAPALLVSMIGMLIGILFLSFAYHNVLYIFMGLAGALGLAAQRTMPEFRVKVGWREVLALALVDGLFLVFIYVYTRMKVV